MDAGDRITRADVVSALGGLALGLSAMLVFGVLLGMTVAW